MVALELLEYYEKKELAAKATQYVDEVRIRIRVDNSGGHISFELDVTPGKSKTKPVYKNFQNKSQENILSIYHALDAEDADSDLLSIHGKNLLVSKEDAIFVFEHLNENAQLQGRQLSHAGRIGSHKITLFPDTSSGI